MDATERDRPDVVDKRKIYLENQSKMNFNSLVFIDESGFRLGTEPLYGRSLKGQRVSGKKRHSGRHSQVTMIGAMSMREGVVMGTITGSVNAEVFTAWLDTVLRPTLREGDILILDNWSVHRSRAVKERLDEWGVQAVFLPPYSPELNPIECFWNTLKVSLYQQRPTSFDELNSCLKKFIELIPKKHIESWTIHSGYTLNE